MAHRSEKIAGRARLLAEETRSAIDGDLTIFEDLTTVLMRPYDEQPGYARYAEPPAKEQRVLRTFCGT